MFGNPKDFKVNRFEAISNAADIFRKRKDTSKVEVDQRYLKVKEVEDWLTVESEEKLTAETTKEGDPDQIFTGSLFSLVQQLDNYVP